MKTLVCLLLLCAVSQASPLPDLSEYSENADIILYVAKPPPHIFHTFIYANGHIVTLSYTLGNEPKKVREGWTAPAFVEDLIARAKDIRFHSQSWTSGSMVPIVPHWVILTFPKLANIKYDRPLDEPIPSAMRLRESVEALIKNADWSNK